MVRDRFKQIADMAEVKGQRVADKIVPVDNRAQSSMNSTLNTVIAVVVSAIFIAVLAPVAINELVEVETTDWPDSVASMFDVLPIIVVLAFFLTLIGMAMRGRQR